MFANISKWQDYYMLLETHLLKKEGAMFNENLQVQFATSVEKALNSSGRTLVGHFVRPPLPVDKYLKLLNVAKASLQELLEDYKDYLRTRGHTQWEENSPQWTAMRNLGREHNDAPYFMELCQTRPPETIANMAIVLINQADYLLFKQLERLEADFITQGGFSEKMK